jgi:hypothetical protein
LRRNGDGALTAAAIASSRNSRKEQWRSNHLCAREGDRG